MRGYPRHIATAQDYKNLLAEKDYAARAKSDLDAVTKASPAKVTVVLTTNADGSVATSKEIDNPAPLWKVKGFAALAEAQALVAVAEVEGEAGEVKGDG